MNTLLIFFAFPVATIILAAVFQMIIKCPIAVSALFFAVFLIITFAFYDANFLIATIAYTILAYISAALTRIIRNVIDRLNNASNIDTECENSYNLSEDSITKPETINYRRCNFHRCR